MYLWLLTHFEKGASVKQCGEKYDVFYLGIYLVPIFTPSY